eukprot:117423-Hanusia_phi.AAC.1
MPGTRTSEPPVLETHLPSQTSPCGTRFPAWPGGRPAPGPAQSSDRTVALSRSKVNMPQSSVPHDDSRGRARPPGPGTGPRLR